MRVVVWTRGSLTTILLLGCLVSHKAISGYEAIHCGNGLFCTQDDREWKVYYKASQRLERITRMAQQEDIANMAVGVKSKEAEVTLAERMMLCADTSFTGFLLDYDQTWPVQCVWNGDDYGAFCAPAPAKNVTFYYMDMEEWKSRLRVFRKKIGCTKEESSRLDEVAEQYVCRERCVQAGISYVASLIMLMSFCISFLLNCM